MRLMTRARAPSPGRKRTAIRMLFPTRGGEICDDNPTTAPRRPPEIRRKLPQDALPGEMQKLLAGPTAADALAIRDAHARLVDSSGLPPANFAAHPAEGDFEHGFVPSFGKGFQERVVPLGDNARDAVQAYLLRRPATS